jgi:sec-independent protein translocase protein TatA
MLEGLLQPTHLLVILAVALFVFGPKKLPELGKGLGDGIRNFRDSMKQATETKPADTTTTTHDSTHDHVA